MLHHCYQMHLLLHYCHFDHHFDHSPHCSVSTPSDVDSFQYVIGPLIHDVPWPLLLRHLLRHQLYLQYVRMYSSWLQGLSYRNTFGVILREMLPLRMLVLLCYGVLFRRPRLALVLIGFVQCLFLALALVLQLPLLSLLSLPHSYFPRLRHLHCSLRYLELQHRWCYHHFLLLPCYTRLRLPLLSCHRNHFPPLLSCRRHHFPLLLLAALPQYYHLRCHCLRYPRPHRAPLELVRATYLCEMHLLKRRWWWWSLADYHLHCQLHPWWTI
mmetsp:Transcript_17240/g.25546  ORF Transcript_17240/g.25546 Transcript_17240/m.25546 type:complete len:269 (+) Transcript_17240:230-1036(+)